MTDVIDSRPVLLIDGKNAYTRHYCANPDMTASGAQIGGAVGFLKMLRRLTSDLSPTRVIIAWEGGGSTRRRALYPEYKANRKPERMNRFYEDDIPDTEDNRVWQVAVLTRMLKRLPVCQVYVSDCEGDDVIAYLCGGRYADRAKIIVSNDRDFYQLLDERTSVYSPQTKRLHTVEDVKKEHHGVPPRNFALAKALVGDRSDNVKGVRGLGFKTLALRIPILAADRDVTIDEVIRYCAARVDEAKVMREVSQSGDLLRLNWRLVYLGGRTLTPEQESRADSIVAAPVPKLDVLSFMRDLIDAGVRTIEDPHGFCSAFVPLARSADRA